MNSNLDDENDKNNKNDKNFEVTDDQIDILLKKSLTQDPVPNMWPKILAEYRKIQAEKPPLVNSKAKNNTTTPIEDVRTLHDITVSLKEIKKIYIHLGFEPWQVELANQLNLGVKELNWVVVKDSRDADAELRLDNHKLMIFNNLNNILWQQDIKLAINPNPLVPLVIADLKKSQA